METEMDLNESSYDGPSWYEHGVEIQGIGKWVTLKKNRKGLSYFKF